MSMLHHLDDVYGVTRGVPLTYVRREGVDDVFTQNLSRQKHIVVFGSSKQGKTTLRKRCLDDDRYVAVTCSNKWTRLEDLHSAILKSAGYVVEQSATKTSAGTNKITAKVEGKAGLPLLGHVKASGAASRDQQSTRSTTTHPLELDAADVNDIIAALTRIGFDRYVVLEDFHYLPDSTQRDFAVALKAFHENSRLSFIVVGVWLDENRLLQFNGDLVERVVAIDADRWTTGQLRSVIERGEELLNVRFDDGFKSQVVRESYASVAVVQAVCHAMCEDAGITSTHPDTVVVAAGRDGKAAVRRVVNKQSGRYEGFLHSFAGGFEDTELDLHRWLLLPVLLTLPEDLHKGLSHGHIQRTVTGHHPDRSVAARDVARALQSTASLQMKLGVKPIIFDYDSSTRRLNVVDLGFVIWLDNQHRRSLLRDLGLPQHIHLPA